jgi:hypothetical protein
MYLEKFLRTESNRIRLSPMQTGKIGVNIFILIYDLGSIHKPRVAKMTDHNFQIRVFYGQFINGKRMRILQKSPVAVCVPCVNDYGNVILKSQ